MAFTDPVLATRLRFRLSATGVTTSTAQPARSQFESARPLLWWAVGVAFQVSPGVLTAKFNAANRKIAMNYFLAEDGAIAASSQILTFHIVVHQLIQEIKHSFDIVRGISVVEVSCNRLTSLV
jgi:hypothetical protein